MVNSTFFIISNVNTAHSHFTPDQRFIQTVETACSIRKYAPGSTVLFCDSSTIPLTDQQTTIMRGLVDEFVPWNSNLFTEWVSSHGRNKGLNEVVVYRHMLEWAMAKRLIGSRVWKISGRYSLTSKFDQTEWIKPLYWGKWIFRTTPWLYNDGAGEYIKTFYNTALWSMCGTLTGQYMELLPKIFATMLSTGENIEVTHRNLIPVDRLHIADSLGAEGYITNGEYTQI